MKSIRFFLSESFYFLMVKFSIYLNRCVFVMNGLLPTRLAGIGGTRALLMRCCMNCSAQHTESPADASLSGLLPQTPYTICFN